MTKPFDPNIMPPFEKICEILSKSNISTGPWAFDEGWFEVDTDRYTTETNEDDYAMLFAYASEKLAEMKVWIKPTNEKNIFRIDCLNSAPDQIFKIVNQLLHKRFQTQMHAAITILDKVEIK